MPIQITTLPFDQAYSDKSALDPTEKRLITLDEFKDKLSQQSFENPTWWSGIDGSKLRRHPKVLIGDREVYKGRFNDKCRFLYISHKQSDHSEHVIIIGYLFKHNDKDIDALITELDKTKEKLLLSITHHITTLTPVVESNDENDDDQQEKSNHRASKHTKLSETQDQVYQRSLRELVLLLGLGGGGKTTTEIESIKRDLECGNSAIYLAPTKGLTQSVAENLSAELSAVRTTTEWSKKNIFLLTPMDFADHLHSLAPEVFPKETRRAARYSDFEKWYQEKFATKRLKSNQKDFPAPDNKTELLRIYSEITSEIMRPTFSAPTISQPLNLLEQYVSEDSYIKSANTHSGITKPKHVYELFRAYNHHLTHEAKTYCEPHNYLWDTFEILRKLHPSELSALQVDATYLDEIQCLPTMILYMCLILNRNTYNPDRAAVNDETKSDRKNGCNFIAAGDTYQDPIHRETRITQRYQEAFQFFGLNQPTPTILKESFRCSHAIGRIANTLLKTIESTIGSFDRNETYGFQVNEENIHGNVSHQTYGAMQQLFKTYRQADVLVIIPDDMPRSHAETKWPKFNILHRSATAGLEEKNVILYGFGDTYAKQLQDLDWQEGEVRYIRKTKGQGGAKQEQINVRDVLTIIYCAVTRSMQHVIFVDDKINPNLQKLAELAEPISSTESTDKEKNTEAVAGGAALAAASPSNKPHTKKPTLIENIKPMTPIERLEKAKRYLTQGDHNPELIAQVSNMLQSSAIWGSQLDLIKQYIDRIGFKDLSLEAQLGVIDKLFHLNKLKTTSEQASTAGDFLSEINKLIKELPKSTTEVAANEAKDKAKTKAGAAPAANSGNKPNVPNQTPEYNDISGWSSFRMLASLPENRNSYAPLFCAKSRDSKPSVMHALHVFGPEIANKNSGPGFVEQLAQQDRRFIKLNKKTYKTPKTTPPSHEFYKIFDRKQQKTIALALLLMISSESINPSEEIYFSAIHNLNSLLIIMSPEDLSVNDFFLNMDKKSDIVIPEEVFISIKKILTQKNSLIIEERQIIMTVFEFLIQTIDKRLLTFFYKLILRNGLPKFGLKSIDQVPGLKDFRNIEPVKGLDLEFVYQLLEDFLPLEVREAPKNSHNDIVDCVFFLWEKAIEEYKEKTLDTSDSSHTESAVKDIAESRLDFFCFLTNLKPFELFNQYKDINNNIDCFFDLVDRIILTHISDRNVSTHACTRLSSQLFPILKPQCTPTSILEIINNSEKKEAADPGQKPVTNTHCGQALFRNHCGQNTQTNNLEKTTNDDDEDNEKSCTGMMTSHKT